MLGLAEREFRAGNAERALECSREALAINPSHHGVFSHVLLMNTVSYLVALNRHDEARAPASEALEMYLATLRTIQTLRW
jgi:hypothetical protein